MKDYPSNISLYRRRPEFPTSLTDLHRLGKSVHGHDGSSRIVMVRKTDQRTFASNKNGKEPKLETITRETIETFRGQRTECKITTEKKDFEEDVPIELVSSFHQHFKDTKNITNSLKKRNPKMEFAVQVLRAHNEYRAKHGAPPLTLNKEMCKYSQEWANVLIKKKALESSNSKEYGENLYYVTGVKSKQDSIDGAEPVKSWYDQIKDYTFGVEPETLKAGNFSQVVWKGSQELGVAFAKICDRVVVVANYLPPGNVRGRFTKNVPPLGGFGPDDEPDISLCNLSLSSSNKSLHQGTSGDFETDFLNAHNEYRKRHGVPLLKLDRKLCKYSEEWAKILTSKNNLEHRKNSPYGENIYCIYSSDPNFTITGHAPVQTWYDEIKNHPFGREPNNLKSGHFTQVIWKTSEFLGVGVAKSRQGYIYVVANYSPAGNFLGNFSENVPPALSTTDNSVKKSIAKSERTGRSITPDPDGFDEFAREGLKVHNEYRKKHGTGDMTLSKELCCFAKEWADNCAKTGNMAHRPNNSYGENIFCLYSSDFSFVPSAKEAVKKWYDEIKEHKFGTETVNHNTLHFTQVVWKASTTLGIAMSKNNKGYTYVVANYEPRGNIVGQFISNVPKPKA